MSEKRSRRGGLPRLVPVTRFPAIPALLLTALVAAPGAAQAFRFPASDLVEAAERYGTEVPRPASVPAPPAGFALAEGTAERRCVEVSGTATMARSGEMVIGGMLQALRVGRNKVWWKPLNSSLDMTIDVVGASMTEPAEALEFQIGAPTAPYANVRPLRQIPEEAFFPAGARFSGPGKWIAVGVSGSDWGCFIFDVPPETPAPSEAATGVGAFETPPPSSP